MSYMDDIDADVLDHNAVRNRDIAVTSCHSRARTRGGRYTANLHDKCIVHQHHTHTE